MASPNVHDRVYFSFRDRHGWHCQFLEADLKTSLPKHLHFSSPDKIIELVERGGGLRRTIHEAYPTTDQVGQT